ncbi:hypothetical protein G6L02_28555 [Agrobacterium rhizogenes]|nr:hypothetical protein [Rhizobium rhizogenes]
MDIVVGGLRRASAAGSDLSRNFKDVRTFGSDCERYFQYLRGVDMAASPIFFVAAHSSVQNHIHLPEGFIWLTGGKTAVPVVALVRNAEDWRELSESFAPGLAAAMVIFSTSDFSAADAVVSERTIAAELSVVADICLSLSLISEELFASDDPSTGLLLYLAVRGRSLKTATNPNAPAIVDFFAERERFVDFDERLQRLVETSLVHSVFEDRLNVCPRCDSARLLIREQCESCGSSNIKEQAILHHLSCACQAPEASFRQPEGLFCPKCRRELRHISVDYEVSASVIECHDCRDLTQEPVIGYRCVDCGGSGTGSDLNERRIDTFHLTAAGRERVGLPSSNEHRAVGRPSRELVDHP